MLGCIKQFWISDLLVVSWKWKKAASLKHPYIVSINAPFEWIFHFVGFLCENHLNFNDFNLKGCNFEKLDFKHFDEEKRGDREWEEGKKKKNHEFKRTKGKM